MSEQIAVRIPEAALSELDGLVANGRYETRAEAVRDAIRLMLLVEREHEIAAEYRRAYGEHPQEDWVGAAGLRLGAAMLAADRAHAEEAS